MKIRLAITLVAGFLFGAAMGSLLHPSPVKANGTGTIFRVVKIQFNDDGSSRLTSGTFLGMACTQAAATPVCYAAVE